MLISENCGHFPHAICLEPWTLLKYFYFSQILLNFWDVYISVMNELNFPMFRCWMKSLSVARKWTRNLHYKGLSLNCSFTILFSISKS